MKEQERYLALLTAPLDSLGSAWNAAAALDLPDDAAGEFLRGVGGVFRDGSSANVAAGAGLVVGSLLSGGLGALGLVAGAMIGTNQQRAREEAVLARVTDAASLVGTTCDAVFDAVWDDLVLRCSAGLELSATYRAAYDRWSGISSRILENASPDTAGPLAEEAVAFIREAGPHFPALHIVIRLSLPPYRAVTEQAVRVAEFSFNHYGAFIPGAAEDYADVLLESGEATKALQLLRSVQHAFADHPGLNLSMVDALAAVGRTDDCIREVQRARAPHDLDAAAFAARGALRRSDVAGAAAFVSSFLAGADAPCARALQLGSREYLEPVFMSGQIPRLGLRHTLEGLIQLCVPAGERRWSGLPPGQKGANAAKEVVALTRREEVLFFHDWSVFGDASTGFAITNRRIQWRCVWEQPVRVPLLDAVMAPPTREGSVLVFSGQRIDMDAEEFAMAIEEVFSLLRQILNGDMSCPVVDADSAIAELRSF